MSRGRTQEVMGQHPTDYSRETAMRCLRIKEANG